jgi:hypothetical protein
VTPLFLNPDRTSLITKLSCLVQLILDRKDQVIKKLMEKKDRAESHLARLLAMQARVREGASAPRKGSSRVPSSSAEVAGPNNLWTWLAGSAPKPPIRAQGGGRGPGAGGKRHTSESSDVSPLRSEAVKAAKCLIDNAVQERIEDLQARASVDAKVASRCPLWSRREQIDPNQ